ncbi:MAG TPA: hypothetical protein VK698_06210, partial [Kofleriaceae bacterium]|nr:hypothetical protein [Kofleriaceae bacterium]
MRPASIALRAISASSERSGSQPTRCIPEAAGRSSSLAASSWRAAARSARWRSSYSRRIRRRVPLGQELLQRMHRRVAP